MGLAFINLLVGYFWLLGAEGLGDFCWSGLFAPEDGKLAVYLKEESKDTSEIENNLGKGQSLATLDTQVSESEVNRSFEETPDAVQTKMEDEKAADRGGVVHRFCQWH